ncbi:unnamed protein product [Calypogeia fissa]
MVVRQAWETIEHIENYGRHEGDQPGYSAQQVPRRPLPPFISRQVWYDAFLAGALDMLATSHAAPPPPSPSQVEVGMNLITLGLPLEGGQLQHDVPTRVLRTGPRSQRRRQPYEHLVVSKENTSGPPVVVPESYVDEERAMDDLMEQFYEGGDDDDIGEGDHVDEGAPPRRKSAHQRQWEEAQGHARTRIYEGSRLS